MANIGFPLSSWRREETKMSIMLVLPYVLPSLFSTQREPKWFLQIEIKIMSLLCLKYFTSFSLYLEKTQLPLQGDCFCMPGSACPSSSQGSTLHTPSLCFSRRSALLKSPMPAAASLEILSPNFGNSDLFFSFSKLLSLELTLWLRW